jgi:hypothetical protein
VWNKQPEHFRIVPGKTYYDGPSFVDDEDVEKLAYNNRNLKPLDLRRQLERK